MTHYIVTNIDQTVQRLMDNQGVMRWISPGKSILLHNPPKESYIFHVEPLTQEAEKAYIEEFKNEGSEMKPAAEKKLNKKQEVKNDRRME
jgi:hypothetical protein